MTLVLDYRGQTSVPVEVEGITPDALRSLAISEIEQLRVFHGNRQASLADFFRVSGDASHAVSWISSTAT